MSGVTEKSAGGAVESTKVHRPAARGAESRESGARVEARVKLGSLGDLGRRVRAGRCKKRWYEPAVRSSRAGQLRLYTAYCRTRSKRGNEGVCGYNNKFIAKSVLKTLNYKTNPRVLSGLLEIKTYRSSPKPKLRSGKSPKFMPRSSRPVDVLTWKIEVIVLREADTTVRGWSTGQMCPSTICRVKDASINMSFKIRIIKSCHLKVLGSTYSSDLKDRSQEGQKTEAVAGKEDDDGNTCLVIFEREEQGSSLAPVNGPVINKKLKFRQSASYHTKFKQNRSRHKTGKDLPGEKRGLEDYVEIHHRAEEDGIDDEELGEHVEEESLELSKRRSNSSCKRKGYSETPYDQNRLHRTKRSEANETQITACEPCAKKEFRRWSLKRHEWKYHGGANARVEKNKCTKLLDDSNKGKVTTSCSKEGFDKFEEKIDNELLKGRKEYKNKKENFVGIETKKRKSDRKKKKNEPASSSKVAETKKRKFDRKNKRKKKDSALKMEVTEKMVDDP